MDEFDSEVLARLPLAQAALSVLRFVCDDELLDLIFDRYRGRCYERDLTFPNLVDLIGDALLEHQGSARKAFRQGRRQNNLAVTDQAAYGKLRRLPLQVSQGFLAMTTARLQELFPDQVSTPLPWSLKDLQVFAIDGKKIKKLAKRLKPARGVEGKVLGGKTLVARDLHLGIAVAMEAHPDGESNDGPLIPGLLGQVAELYPDESCLWILDSQFCDLTTPKRILVAGHQFLVRYHPKVQFHRASHYQAREGIDDRGRSYREEIGRLGSPKNTTSNRPLVRRITVNRPEKDELILITSLLDMEVFPATDLLEAYAGRWSIETMFQHVTEVFCLQRLIGGTAQASVFQCSFCLLLFNIIHLLRIHISAQRDMEADEISMKNVFDDVQSELTALRVLLPTQRIVTEFCTHWTANDVRRHLQSLLKSNWQDHWVKAPKNQRLPPPPKRRVSGGHTSIERLIKQHALESRVT